MLSWLLLLASPYSLLLAPCCSPPLAARPSPLAKACACVLPSTRLRVQPCSPGTYNLETELNGKLRICRACPLGSVQPFANQTRCEPCDTDGSMDCNDPTRLLLSPGYFIEATPVDQTRPNSWLFNVKANRCPYRSKCAGGNLSTTGFFVGTGSCNAGHTGPLCGECSDGHYRALAGCERCPRDPFPYAAVVICGLLAAALIIYLGGGAAAVLPPRIYEQLARLHIWHSPLVTSLTTGR